jgi:hypothetical protein
MSQSTGIATSVGTSQPASPFTVGMYAVVAPFVSRRWGGRFGLIRP